MAPAPSTPTSRRHQVSKPPPTGWTVREILLLPVLAAAVVFPAWNVGGITVWADWTWLALGVAGLCALLVPLPWIRRHQRWRLRAKDNFLRLAKFPILWLGLAFLVLLYAALLNPWATFHSNGYQWWIVSQDNVSWLPASVRAPFGAHNAERAILQWSAPLLLVCVFWTALVRPALLRVLLGAALINACVFCAVTLAQTSGAIEGLNVIAPVSPHRELFGSFVNTNAAGMYLYLHLALALGCALQAASEPFARWPQNAAMLLSLIAGCLIGATLVSTLSRGALLFGGLIVLMFLMASLRSLTQAAGAARFRLGALVAGCVLSVGAVALLLGPASTQKAQEEVSSLFEALRNPTGEARLTVFRTCIGMFTEKPVFGWGPNGFRFAYPEFQRKAEALQHDHRDGQPAHYYDYAHSDWLQFTIEYGFVGVALLATIVGWWLRQAFRQRHFSGPIEGFLVFSATLTLFHAAFDFVFYNPPVLATVCLWLCLGVRLMHLKALRNDL